MVLASDQYLPPESQPKFFARVLSVRQAEELQDKRDQGGKKSLAIALEVLMEFLTGWENMTHPDTGEPLDFNVENLKEVLTIDELHEVVDFAVGTIKPTGDDQKKSESPPS